MDLEVLFQACWRRKLRLLGAMLLGAVLAVAIGTAVLPNRYTSTADLSVLAVFPGSTTAHPTPAAQVYSMYPDRFVQTQVEIISSHQAVVETAKRAGVTPDQVQGAITVEQVAKSDVVRIKATTGNAVLSGKVVGALVDAYLAEAGVNQVQSKLVSAPSINPKAVGPGRATLAAYGGILGLAVGCAWLAFTVRPGQSLAEIDGAEEYDGTPVLGVVTQRGRLASRPHAGPPMENLRRMAVVDRLAGLVQDKGAVQLVVVDTPAYTRRVRADLAPLVMARSGASSRDEMDRSDDEANSFGRLEFQVSSLQSFLPGQVTPGYVVVGFDLGRVTRPQLDEVLFGLEGIGAKVLGLVGFRR